MRHALIALLAATLAAPVISIPTPSDAQVLAGRGAASRASRAPRVSREERLLNLIAEAEERAEVLDDRIAEIQAASETAGALTPAQERQLAQLNERRERERREITRLNEALGA